MDKIVIEVPKGQVAKVNKQADGNVLVTFETIEHWKLIKDVNDAIQYLASNCMCLDLLEEYQNAPSGSYTEKLAAYRIVVAALTNNEERRLDQGGIWYPIVQYCYVGAINNCIGKTIIGYIESEGMEFVVVGGTCSGGDSDMSGGLGNFSLTDLISLSQKSVGFLSVSQREIAEHISRYFGRLLFEVRYGGVNCNWKWVD